MSVIMYIFRNILMLLVTWVGVRLIGKKSISQMTSYDFAAIMLLSTVAAEPLVYKISSKATIGVFTLVIGSLLLSELSLSRFFYNIDSRPTILIADGKIIEKELKKSKMNLPLLLSELRLKGYQNVSDIRYAIVEPSGQISVVPKSQTSPVTPKQMGIPSAPVNLSFPLIIDGKVDDNNLKFLNRNRDWLKEQLKAFEIGDFSEVFLAQYDSQGQLYVNTKNKQVEIPNVF